MGGPANLAAALRSRAEAGGWAQEAAFLAGDRTVTHAQVHDGAGRAASLLAGAGCGPGDRVLIAAADGLAFLWAFLGAVHLGALAVPVNPRLTEADHHHAAGDTDPRVVVCSAGLAGRFGGRAVLTAEAFEAALARCPWRPAADAGWDRAAYAQYTSGTTGPPKAAVHAHRDPLVYAEAFAGPALGLGRHDVVLSASKLYFAYGLGNSLLFPLLAGCRAVLHPGPPDPAAVAALVARHRVTVLFGVPTFYARLVAGADPASFTTLRAAVSAGEALIPALAERARRFLGCPVLDGLGSTEVGQTFASNTLQEWRDGTVGRALPPYAVSVRDEGGDPLPPGRVGSLWVKGPTVALEYLNQPAATAAARRGEWLVTGDRAELDGDGFLHLRGRADDVELVGGMCVSPLEIEAELSRHPGVTELAVAGVVDGDGASRLVAFVVPAAGAAAPAADLAGELTALARRRLAPFKVPRQVVFVDALPRTPTGKLRRFVLRAGPGAAGGGAGGGAGAAPGQPAGAENRPR